MPGEVLEKLLGMTNKEGRTPLDMIEAMRQKGDAAGANIEDDLTVKRGKDAKEGEKLEQEAKTEIQMPSIWGRFVHMISGTGVPEEETEYPVGVFWD